MTTNLAAKTVCTVYKCTRGEENKWSYSSRDISFDEEDQFKNCIVMSDGTIVVAMFAKLLLLDSSMKEVKRIKPDDIDYDMCRIWALSETHDRSELLLAAYTYIEFDKARCKSVYQGSKRNNSWIVKIKYNSASMEFEILDSSKRSLFID